MLNPPTKPVLPPFWKWLMRITFAFTMVLFLAPAFYAAKYYALDLPRETALAQPHQRYWRRNPHDPDDLLAEAKTASEPLAKTASRADSDRVNAVRRMGETLCQPLVTVKRPIECLSAKATLADLAIHAPSPEVRAAASEELGKVAQGGAVIRR